MRRIVFALLITAIVIGSMHFISKKTSADNRTFANAVYAEVKDIYSSVSVNGIVREKDARNIALNATSKITRILVRPGERVRAGDVLFHSEKLQTDDAVAAVGAFKSSQQELTSELAKYGLEYVIDDVFRPADEICVSEYAASPIDGVVTKLNVTENQVYPGFTSAVTVSDFENLYVLADIPERYANDVKTGMRTEIQGDAFPDTKYFGSVESIFPVAKQTLSISGESETYVEAVISVQDKHSLLKPGYTTKLRIVTNTVKNAVTLPYECIMQDASGEEYVYVIEHGKAKRRSISSGYELDDELEITSGVSDKDIVVINPSDDIENAEIIDYEIS